MWLPLENKKINKKNFDFDFVQDQLMASGNGLLLKTDEIADPFRDEVQSALAQCPRAPRLVGILATSSSPSKHYAEFTQKQCDSLGVDFVLRRTGAAENSELEEGDGVEEAIIEANEDPDVDGIMVPISIDTPSFWSIELCFKRCTTRYLGHSRFVYSGNLTVDK